MPPTHAHRRVLLALALVIGAGSDVGAAERTFTLSAARVTSMIDEFNASLLAHASALNGTVALRRGQLTLTSKSACPSLTGDPQRRASRIRILDGAARAAALVSKKPNAKLLAALSQMGGETWSTPADGRTHRAWTIEPGVGVIGFSDAAYPIGECHDGIDASQVADTDPSFLVRVNLADPLPSASSDVVVAVTTELPAKQPGGRPKRTVCYLVAAIDAADIDALRELLAATPVSDATRTQLGTLLAQASDWRSKGRLKRARLLVKQFGIRVADLSAAEIPPDAAQALLTRTLAVDEALNY